MASRSAGAAGTGTRSIERLLLVWVLGALTFGAAALVGVTYWLTLDELDEVFDENLKQVALATAYHHSIGIPPAEAASAIRPPSAASLPSSPSARRRPLLPRLPRIYDSEGEFDFITLVGLADGTLLFTSDGTVNIPFLTQTGIQHTERPDGEWHIYTIVQPDVIIQAAQRESSRNVLAAEVASKMFVPLAALVVLIGTMLVIALRRALRSLDLAAASVAQRTAHTLEPVPIEDKPREIHPLIRAINDLLARLAVTLFTQRRFVADAAHELRTPITALRLQLQLLERAKSDAERMAAIRDLDSGVQRSQHLVEQLLHLSRYEPGDGTPGPAKGTIEAVDLSHLVRDVVGSMSVKADHHHIDLGADAAEPVVVEADHEQMLVMVNNLVENALRYTPRGGVVDVKAMRLAGRPAVIVVDSGPGIPVDERERVFDRFYRGDQRPAEPHGASGSGLGLAIVKAIAERHHARVSLHTAPDGRGLEARVVWETA